jgi:hypothetical protein
MLKGLHLFSFQTPIFVRDCVSPENCGFTTSFGLRNSLTFTNYVNEIINFFFYFFV